MQVLVYQTIFRGIDTFDREEYAGNSQTYRENATRKEEQRRGRKSQQQEYRHRAEK
ncbi:MAG: hypothetical protein AB7T18_00345 [Alphaproteobacteria bacterium]